MCIVDNERREKVEDMGIVLPEGQMIKDLGESEYKYLRVLEACEIKAGLMKKSTTDEYKRWLRLLLRSKLSFTFPSKLNGKLL